jgi:hypothetical protein
MRKLVFAALAALSLGTAVMAQPVQAKCWHVPGGRRCVHHRVVVHHSRRHYHYHRY